MRLLSFVTVLLMTALLAYAAQDFPLWGDPDTPAWRHQAVQTYVTEGYEKTHVPNLVSAILADYRNFDTMFETTVIFTAGLAILVILRGTLTPDPSPFTRRPGHLPELRPDVGGRDLVPLDRDPIIETACRLLFPPIQLFALYVLAHGHHSPGGGFQGGVIMAAAYILLAITFDLKSALKVFPPRRQLLLATLGVIIYSGTGFACLFLGGDFFDYGALARVLPVSVPDAHSLGILVVETGVALTVMAVLFSIYADLSSRGRHQEGL